jgi:hypothetical protein
MEHNLHSSPDRDGHAGRSWMMRTKSYASLIVAAVLMMLATSSSQTQRQGETLSVQGYAGEANVVRMQSRIYVDLEEFARITNASLSFEDERIILALPRKNGIDRAPQKEAASGFSGPFIKAGIEAMASIREWGGMLQVIVENGYPVGKAMAGNTILAYQGRAADSVSFAATSASTDSDYRGLELLRNEFNNLQGWAESFVDARNSLNAANLSISEHPLKDDQDVQKMIQCGQFLAQMFVSGKFQDNSACH